jgi:lantibiotic leader peptide-processing serine protease
MTAILGRPRAAAAALLAGAFTLTGGVAAAPPLAEPSTYLVVYREQAVPTDASASLGRAGGSLINSYAAIGVAIVASSNPSFRAEVLEDARVEDASPSAAGAVRLKRLLVDEEPNASPQRGLLSPSIVAPTTPASGAPSAADEAQQSPVDFTARQWDMRQIDAFDAHRVTRGSRSVLVGNIDTGIDATHPDLRPNIDFENSVSCIGGVADQSPAAWDDRIGHGTHTSGIIAAASNSFGITGVAPNVRIAAIKAGTDNGYFYPEAVVCAFMWAATHNVAIANNSYIADPYYLNCPSDPEQAAILTAEQRAISFAQSRGVIVISAMHNHSDDLANPTQDRISPTDGTPVTRPVDRSCVAVPLHLPGVIGVGSTGSQGLKSITSNYGLGVVDVVAPGGDARLQPLADEGGGRVLSTWPTRLSNVCTRRIPQTEPDPATGVYCYQQGTSMATPHVTGVAALLLSRAIERSRSGFDKLALVSLLSTGVTDRVACPSRDILSRYSEVRSRANDQPQTCTGSNVLNSWYGFGQINAHKAVSFSNSSHLP